jgi:hypothetical protein
MAETLRLSNSDHPRVIGAFIAYDPFDPVPGNALLCVDAYGTTS